MDAVKLMGEIVKRTAELTADKDGLGCAKLVVFANAVEDNPFMAGAFHGVGESDTVINVGVSGPGVVKHALENIPDANLNDAAEMIKRTAFKITRAGQLVAKEAAKRLNAEFGIVDLSLAPTPAMGDSASRTILGGTGAGMRGRTRHDGGARPAQRRGEKGRRHGKFARGRACRARSFPSAKISA